MHGGDRSVQVMPAPGHYWPTGRCRTAGLQGMSGIGSSGLSSTPSVTAQAALCDGLPTSAPATREDLHLASIVLRYKTSWLNSFFLSVPTSV